jgi:hypothetical protein
MIDESTNECSLMMTYVVSKHVGAMSE